MEYKLSHPSNVAHTWLGVFETLSLDYRDIPWKLLGFMKMPDSELKQFAKDFTLTYYSRCANVPLQGTPTRQLISLTTSGWDMYTELWDTTLVYLKQVNWLQDIYLWGSNTFTNLKFFQAYPSSWQFLLYDLSQTTDPTDMQLPFDDEKAQGVCGVMKNYHHEKGAISQILETLRIFATSESAWDAQLISVYSWMQSQIHHATLYRHWRELFLLLSNAEMEAFEAWAIAREGSVDEEEFKRVTYARLKSRDIYTEEQIRLHQEDMLKRHRRTLVQSGNLLALKRLVDELPY
jgi:hypothetical protein